PAAEMRDRHPAFRKLGRNLSQPARDVLVGKAMKSVAPHSFRVEVLGDRKAIGNLRMASVECRIEAGDLQYVRLSRQDRADWTEGIWLVKRRQWCRPSVATEAHIVDDPRFAI